jgi:rod shape-determining protein MreC
LDLHYRPFQNWHAKFSAVVAPIQILVDTPIKMAKEITTNLQAQSQLVEDNAKLRVQLMLLDSQLQKLLTLERENAQLRELLRSTPQTKGNVMVAKLLAVDLDPSLQQVIIDRGASDKLYLGQPVLDAYGVMGQVISIGPMTSRVLLITDPKSAVPVQNYRTGSRSIAIGSAHSGQLRLINVPETNDIQEGDLYVTSGMGQRFPVGYPVGVVSKAAMMPGDRFVNIFLIPSAHLDKTEQVLLSWPEQANYDLAVQKQLSGS